MARKFSELNAASLEALLEAVAQGDHEAFAALHAAVAAEVYGVIHTVLRDPAQSAETAQEVLLEVWRFASRYERARGTALTWVLTIAHRRAVDRVRTEQTFRDRTTQLARDPVEPLTLGRAELDADPVADILERHVEREQVRHALTQLSERQRAAITLAYYRGFSASEIAELIDAPLGTVKTRLRDGLRRLRAILTEDEPLK